MDIFWIRLLHVFVIGLFLLWVGLAVPEAAWIYLVVLAAGVFLLVYWLVTVREQDVFWTVWHLLVAVFLCWIGIQGSGSPRFLFKILVLLGVAAIGYHLIGLVRDRCAALLS